MTFYDHFYFLLACGAFLSGISGSFEFPGEGQLYPHGVSCAWVIDTDDDKVNACIG